MRQADLPVVLPALLSGITWPHTARRLLRRGHGARARQTQIFGLLGAVSHLNESHRSATELSRAITDRVTTFGPALCGVRGERGNQEPGALVMDIPLELERRCERRWAARFSSRIVSGRHQPRRPEDSVNRLPRPKAAESCPPARTGEAAPRKVPVVRTWSSQDCKATEE